VKRIAVIGACAAALCLVFAALPAGATPRLAPPALLAGWEDQFVKASRGSYCWSSSTRGLCVDYVYPLEIKQRLAVVGHSPLAFRVGARAHKVSLALLNVENGKEEELRFFRAKPASPSRRRWLTHLPADLGNANVLDVFVDYRHNRGDADFWVGLDSGEAVDPSA
jgi:hypothetical protein